MPDIDYIAETACSHEMQHNGSTWAWYRSSELIEVADLPEYADPLVNYLNDVFTLKQTRGSELLFQKDFTLEPFLASGVTYTEDTSKGEVNVSYSSIKNNEIMTSTEGYDEPVEPVTSLIHDGVCVFCPFPEGQLLAVSIGEDNKGQELWRKDARHPKYYDTITAWQLLFVDEDGLFVVAFRERRVSVGEQRIPAWNPEWGVDDDYSVIGVRVPDNSGAFGWSPAGICWIRPRTGTVVARWDAEKRFLSPPSIPREVLYESFPWNPGGDGPGDHLSDESWANVPRPYGSTLVGAAPDGQGGYTYSWSDDDAEVRGHARWGFASVRASGAGLTEWRNISANSDFRNPFAFINQTDQTASLIVHTPPGAGYYVYKSQTITWRYMGEGTQQVTSDNQGGDPPHSLLNACAAPGGLVIFGPRGRGNYSGNVEVYDPKNFTFRAIRRAGGQSTVVWETVLEGALPFRQSTVPLCVGSKVLSVIVDENRYVGEIEYGVARFVALDSATGALLWDRPLDPALWASSGEDYFTQLHPIAEVHRGRFVVRINGYNVFL